MTGEDILEIFKRTGGYITGSHIVYTSGKHGDSYLNKDAIYPHTKEISAICLEIAKYYQDQSIDVVAAPALGGIILSQWTAFHLSNLTGKDILGVYTEKTPEKNQIFTRGYDSIIKGKKVLVVEDIANTAGSIKKVIASVRQVGGVVIGACVIANRDPNNNTSESLGVPFHAMVDIYMDAWDETACTLCKANIPVNTTVGKGREYLDKKG